MDNQPFNPYMPTNPYQGAQPAHNPYSHTPTMPYTGMLSIRASLKYAFTATFNALWIWLALSLLHTATLGVTNAIQERIRQNDLLVEHLMHGDEFPWLEILNVVFAPQNLAISFIFHLLTTTFFVPLFLAIALVQLDGLKLHWENIKPKLSSLRGFVTAALLWVIVQTPLAVLMIFFLDLPYRDLVTGTIVGSFSYSIAVFCVGTAWAVLTITLFFFMVHSVLDGKATVFGALGESFSLFAQHPLRVFAGLLSIHVINTLMTLSTCGLGALLVAPLLANFSAHLYRQLSNQRYTQVLSAGNNPPFTP
ncbi:hypothetical protein P4N68_09640 [Corynebacterium felinum]|uniref:Membrane protein n=1 Tax=Corynebacterium felinum TaxID=131318 RepID=A0ABU2BEQ2_9CORY|nr:hypothetical protein [Corynebacterium felinum]MDF5821338.1 hypothetical protein [Corynebacterium felinum]MDR7355864.1 putative membrane protein [Corynebacterium felinum]